MRYPWIRGKIINYVTNSSTKQQRNTNQGMVVENVRSGFHVKVGFLRRGILDIDIITGIK